MPGGNIKLYYVSTYIVVTGSYREGNRHDKRALKTKMETEVLMGNKIRHVRHRSQTHGCRYPTATPLSPEDKEEDKQFDQT